MLITKIVGIAKEKWFVSAMFCVQTRQKMNARRNHIYVRSNRKEKHLLFIQLEMIQQIVKYMYIPDRLLE